MSSPGVTKYISLPSSYPAVKIWWTAQRYISLGIYFTTKSIYIFQLKAQSSLKCLCVTVILPCVVKALYLPVKVKSLQQLYPPLSGRYTVRRNRLHHLQTRHHTFKDQQASDAKPTPKSWMHTHSEHLLQIKDDENGWGCKDDINWNSNRLHYFFSPRLVFDIRLLIVESCSWYVSCSLCQKLWLSAGK